MRKGLALVFLIVLTLAVNANDVFQLEQTEPAQLADWTVMVYMAAENNLERYAIKDINEMEEVGSSDKLNIIALIDRWDGYHWVYKDGNLVRERSSSDYTGNDNWTDTRVYRILKDDSDDINSELISSGMEINSGDPKNLENFIHMTANRYPARKYLVIVWNHGGGIQGIAWDDNERSDDHISAKALGVAFNNAVNRIINRNRGLVDMVGFDACLMNMYEIADELSRNQVGTMVGSEELEPGDGWPYDEFLEYLRDRVDAGRDVSETALARQIVDDFIDSYDGWFFGLVGGNEATLSAVSLYPTSKFDSVNAKIDQLIGLILEDDDNFLKLHNAAKNSQKYDFWTYYVDLIDFMNKIEDEFSGEIAQKARDVVREIRNNRMIIANDTHGSSVEDSNGLSIYFPLYRRKYRGSTPYLIRPYNRDSAKFTALHFGKNTKWKDMIEQYYRVLDTKTDEEVGVD